MEDRDAGQPGIDRSGARKARKEWDDVKARDAMVAGVVAVQGETPVEEIVRLLTAHELSAVPVVDEAGRVVGMIDQSDVFLQERHLPFTEVTLPELFDQPVNPDSAGLDEAYARARGMTAGEVLARESREVVTVDAEEDLGQVAWLMAREKLERAPVLDGGRLVGTISRGDVLRALARTE